MKYLLYIILPSPEIFFFLAKAALANISACLSCGRFLLMQVRKGNNRPSSTTAEFSHLSVAISVTYKPRNWGTRRKGAEVRSTTGKDKITFFTVKVLPPRFFYILLFYSRRFQLLYGVEENGIRTYDHSPRIITYLGQAGMFHLKVYICIKWRPCFSRVQTPDSISEVCMIDKGISYRSAGSGKAAKCQPLSNNLKQKLAISLHF